MKKTLLLTGFASLCASSAFAQNSVSLYGMFDAGLTYTSNDQQQKGRQPDVGQPLRGFAAAKTSAAV